ncbi:MAG: hypothetical protein MK206_00480, partial [Candidatus Poseidoniia archaeon]|nr:hypothetical protein [Candidatus Poseidoniia archaeon]
MKVCPVCQYEEEDGNEVACAICGSDLESEEAPVEEPTTEEPTTNEESIEDKTAESVDDNESGEDVSETEETSEMTDEEKEIEAALAGTEISSSDDSESGLDSNKYLSILSNFNGITDKFISAMDGVFKKNGKITYASPLAALFVAILIFFSVLAVAAMTVPRGLEVNQEGEAIYVQNGPSYDRSATPTSEPSSGEPFNCEMWDRQRYIDYRDEETDNLITDVRGNNSGEIDDEERYGCPVNITMLSGSLIFILNLIFLTLAFYLYKTIPNTSLTLPMIIFGSSQILLFIVYGGLLDNLIFALPLTFGFACAVCLIVSVSLLFGKISLERPLDEPVSLNFYFFVIVVALLLSSVFLNYAQGPYAVCSDPYTEKPTPYEPLNDYGMDGIIGTNDFGENNGLWDEFDSFDDFGNDGIKAFDRNNDGFYSPEESFDDIGRDGKLSFDLDNDGNFNPFNEFFEDFGRDRIAKVDYDNDGNYTHINDTAPDEDGSEGNGVLDWEDENGNGAWDDGEGEYWEDENENRKFDPVEIAPDEDGSEGNGQYDPGEPFNDAKENGQWDEAEIAPDEDDSEGDGTRQETEVWYDDNENGKWDPPEFFYDTDGDGLYDDNYTNEKADFLSRLSSMNKDEVHACQLLEVNGEA